MVPKGGKRPRPGRVATENWSPQIPNGVRTTASLAGDGPVRRQHFAMLNCVHDPIERVRAVHVQDDRRPAIPGPQLDLREAPGPRSMDAKRAGMIAAPLAFGYQRPGVSLGKAMRPNFFRCIVDAREF